MDYFVNGLDGKTIQEKYGLSGSRINNIIWRYMWNYIRKCKLPKVEFKDSSIEEGPHKNTIADYDISNSLYNSICRIVVEKPDGSKAYVKYPEDLIGLTKSQLMNIRGFGKARWQELLMCLPVFGLALNEYDLENPVIVNSGEVNTDEYPHKLLRYLNSVCSKTFGNLIDEYYRNLTTEEILKGFNVYFKRKDLKNDITRLHFEEGISTDILASMYSISSSEVLEIISTGCKKFLLWIIANEIMDDFYFGNLPIIEDNIEGGIKDE